MGSADFLTSSQVWLQPMRPADLVPLVPCAGTPTQCNESCACSPDVATVVQNLGICTMIPHPGDVCIPKNSCWGEQQNPGIHLNMAMAVYGGTAEQCLLAQVLPDFKRCLACASYLRVGLWSHAGHLPCCKSYILHQNGFDWVSHPHEAYAHAHDFLHGARLKEFSLYKCCHLIASEEALRICTCVKERKLDAILVLRIQDGNDIFLSISGSYVPSFYGLSLGALAAQPRCVHMIQAPLTA